jgi:hypothetical protein
MEEEHGHSNSSISTTTRSIDGSLDGSNARPHMEVDQETSQKPIPLSQRIITDCC